ncbi:MAG: DUF1295 domain-containing protein [Candidatus Saccharimonas sp.]
MLLYVLACALFGWQQGFDLVAVQRIAVCSVIALGFMVMVFFMARRNKRWDIIDVAWGLCITLIAWTHYFLYHGITARWSVGLVTVLLVSVWGVRLSWHIGQRFIRSKKEDERYVTLRSTWRGSETWNMFLRVYCLQAILALLCSLPVLYVTSQVAASWQALTAIGAMMVVLGISIELVADWQLAQYLKHAAQPTTFTGGLWRYSRHPNYFGELVVWWGFACMALSGPKGWVGLGGALLITYLIVYVSGVPLNEQRAVRRPGWAAYARRTNTLIPWFPRR